ncbi:hypothetical protein V5O48_005946 [Marasmius crinis-equi]|uniref:Uncharacterized protein n=1 Tax=Marasmius crinis-equi TaxID=585013 RepID=A0ABR3FKZ1_9AGAR
MPPRRVKQEPQDEESHFALSQASNASSSDDNAALEAALAEQFMVSKEKKKKENQQRFLVAAKKHILKEIYSPVEELKATVQSVEELIQAFIINLASEEDNIRKIWCDILEEEQKLLSFVETCRTNNDVTRKTAEELHIKGLSKIQTVCSEYQGVIDFVNLKSSS